MVFCCRHAHDVFLCVWYWVGYRLVASLNQLLIVTCYRDQLQFKIQCQSIGRHLEPVALSIVINELDPYPWLTWYYQHCDGLLHKHQVQILTYNDFVDIIDFKNLFVHNKPISGWIRQQIFKLAFAQRCSQAYWIFDTKNWLIRPANLKDFHKRPRINIPVNQFMQSSSHDKFYFDLIDKLCPGQYYTFRPEITPYAIDHRIVNGMYEWFGGTDKFESWFVSHASPSEFIAYDVFAQHLDLDCDQGQDMTNAIYYYGNSVTVDQIAKNCLDPKLQMVSIHHSLLDSALLLQLETLLNTE